MPARAWPGATKTSTVSIRLSEQLRFSSEPAGASLVIQFSIYCVRCCLDILFSRFIPYWFVVVGGGGCHWDRYSQIVACKEVPTTWSDHQRWLAGCVMVPDKTPADSTRKFPPLSTPCPGQACLLSPIILILILPSRYLILSQPWHPSATSLLATETEQE